VVNGEARPILLHLTAGQVSDYKGAAALIDKLPKAKDLLADRGYDVHWFRTALIEIQCGFAPFRKMFAT
jgi:transposase